MSETVANLTDSIEYDRKIDTEIEGYVFHDDNDRRYTLCLTTYGYQIAMPNISVNISEIKLTKFGQIELFRKGAYISSIHDSQVPDNMFEALKIIADDS